MPALTKLQVEQAERQLKQAMLASDVAVLSQLLADDLLFINHMGEVVSKQADLAMHRSGLLKINAIDLANMQICCTGNHALVYVQAHIHGCYGSQPANGCFVFSRLWRQTQDGLEVVAAHSNLRSSA